MNDPVANGSRGRRHQSLIPERCDQRIQRLIVAGTGIQRNDLFPALNAGKCIVLAEALSERGCQLSVLVIE